MPVRSRQVASGAADRLSALGEPVEGVRDLAQRADLPGDLVDGALRLLRPFVQRRIGLAGEEDERMMVGAVAGGGADPGGGPRRPHLPPARAGGERGREGKTEPPA